MTRITSKVVLGASLLLSVLATTPAMAMEAPTINGSRALRGRVHLTFDDGPHPSRTPRLLDILKRHDVKATFFMCGNNARAHPRIVRRAYLEGHTIANHSETHTQLTRLGRAGIEREVMRAHEALTSALSGAYEPHHFRPPYGSHNRTVREVLGAHGYINVLWDTDSLDWQLRNRRRITEKVLREVGDGGIILLHDIHEESIMSVPAMIEGLRANGLELVPTIEALTDDSGAPAPRTLPEAEVIPVTAGSRGKVNASSLNIRSGPGVGNPPLGTPLPGGSQVEILIAQGDWLQVKTADGREGFVSARFIDVERVAEPVAAEPAPAAAAAEAPRAPADGAEDRVREANAASRE